MRIAIPHWQGRVSPVFDVAGTLCLIDIEEGRETGRRNIMLTSRDPFRRAVEVSALRVDVLICGAVSHPFERALLAAGVRVLCCICGEIGSVIDAYLGGRLSSRRFLMPGCPGNRRGQRYRHRGGRSWP
ncbi:MAG: hypothetical protein A4E73_03817 [Syntrophaceae bacterium PtaU1.Bin231]|nr:MAG: hypothetical protein A4E73_03817 [Syntrophaceae bacterium PtaU1.Bin231]